MSLATAEHLAATQQFIDANPVVVTTYRSARTPDGRGGSIPASATPVAQTAGRLVGHTPGLGEGSRTAPDGHQVSLKYSFVVMPDTDIREGDYFDINDRRYTVLEVSISPPWRLTAEVMEA